jgi:hypothetical protein
MIEFKSTRVDIGNVLPGSVTQVEFEYTGDKSEISDVIPSCGCTANAEILDNLITLQFTESDSSTRSNLSNIDSQFPSGYWPFVKSATVFLNDGKDLKVLGANGLVFNPDKEKITIEFVGRVKFK